MREEELNGKTIQVQEQKDWKTSIDKNFKPGDYFDEDIAWDLINSVPPTCLSAGFFQCGEPHDHAPDKHGVRRPRFLTLIKVKAKVWKFIGYCHVGELQEEWQ